MADSDDDSVNSQIPDGSDIRNIIHLHIDHPKRNAAVKAGQEVISANRGRGVKKILGNVRTCINSMFSILGWTQMICLRFPGGSRCPVSSKDNIVNQFQVHGHRKVCPITSSLILCVHRFYTFSLCTLRSLTSRKSKNSSMSWFLPQSITADPALCLIA